MSKLILLSAGGTGGHLFPAEALAHELRGRGYRVGLVTDRRAERFASAFPAGEIHVVPSATITSKNPIALLRTAVTLLRGMRACDRLIARLRPALVVGFGGYPTLPPLMAATRAGVPTLIQEQNGVMGRANRFLAGRVDAIAGGFLPAGTGKHGDKIVTTGNPVRPDVLLASGTPYPPLSDSDPFRLLVFGGSQGARVFSEIVPEAVDLLPAPLRARLRITQQARSEDKERVEAHYRDAGITAEVSTFFDRMAEHIAAAHLVVSRAGASTVSEIAVIGRPAILVPLPHALDHDQDANAAALAETGGGRLVRQSALSAATLSGILNTLSEKPDELKAMAAQARAAGHPDATRRLADLAVRMAEGQAVAETMETEQ